MNLIKKELIFENTPFIQCHASTIVLLEGNDKLCA